MPLPHQRLFRGVFLVSLGTLLYELALIRVLSFTIWYHFAYVVISTALLGFGASGTLLAVRPRIGERDLGRTLAACSAAAGVSGAAFLASMGALPFDPMAITRSGRALFLLCVYQVGATVPFFFAGITISLSLRAAASRVDRLYFWDLVGAGIGCAASVALMNAVGPPNTLFVACALLAFAGVLFAGRTAMGTAAAVTALALLGLSVGPKVPLAPAASKHLAQHLTTDRMKLLETRWSALFRTDAVASTPESPWNNETDWGLSRTIPYVAQTYWGFITHDGSAGAPLYDRRAGNLDFLDDHLLRFPYLVANPAPKVLVIGVGGGRDVYVALRYGASHVTGVELDPNTLELIRGRLLPLANGALDGPRVELVSGEGRHFIDQSRDSYDVIQITGVDTLAAQTSGAYVLAENFLYTTEAFHAYLAHLKPGGLVSIATGEWNPDRPQMTGRMSQVAREALLENGLEPTSRMAIFHSQHLLTNVLVKNEPFSASQIAALKAQAERLAFLPLWLPTVPSHPAFTSLMTTTGDEHRRVVAGMRYVVDPVTDEKPFFFRFHRWNRLLESEDFGPFLGTALGQLLLLVLLGSLTLLGGGLILLPLAIFRRRGLADRRRSAGILVYFLAIGLGFMLLEISLMQRFVLYLGYPTYALSIVLLSLLSFLGVGSFVSKRWVGQEHRVLPVAVVALGVLVVAYSVGLPKLFGATLGAPLAVRALVSVLLLAPLGLSAGIFFPLGIRRAELVHADLVPWAWGVNGCASVTASVLAVVIGMEYGFVPVWGLALGVYAAGTFAFLRLCAPAT